MKETKLILWHYYPGMIHWKINTLQKENDLKSNLRALLGISILVDLTTFIEGICFDIVYSVCNRQSGDSNKAQILQKIDNKPTWMNYTEYIKSLTGKELIFFADSKSIEILFKFRNNLVHANNLQFSRKGNGSIEFNTKWQEIIDYLSSNGLLETSKPYDISTLINIDIVRYFITKADNFVLSLFNEFPSAEIASTKLLYEREFPLV